MSKILQLCQYYLHSEGLQGLFFFPTAYTKTRTKASEYERRNAKLLNPGSIKLKLPKGTACYFLIKFTNAALAE